MTRNTSTARAVTFAFALAAVFAHGGGAAAAPLRACIDEASPAADADARVADAVAAADGGTAQIHRYKGVPKGDDDDFEVRNYKALLAEHCDFVLGFPLLAEGAGLPRFLKATRPYATTGFVLVTRAQDAPASLGTLAKGARVAVAYNTLPNFYFRRHPNLEREIVESEVEALDAVATHAVAGAMLWRASAVRRLERTRTLDRFRFTPLDEPNARYDLVALYRSDAADAARRFERAMDAARASGALAQSLGRYADIATPAALPNGDAPPHAAVSARLPRAHRSARTCAAGKAAKTPEALYAADQAAAGQELFADKCAMCHGPQLEGRAGPALKGKFFLSEQGKHTLGDIFTIVSQNMPATLPASLPPDNYVRIMAYLLQENGYPAGSNELTFDAAKKSKVQLRYRGP